jgi:glutathione peroxidase
VYEFTVKDIDNQEVKLDKYKGKVLLIVNVASKCGFTKTNYKELNELYNTYHDQGLEILGFPCNQFGHQEPGCDVDIKEFMKKNQVQWDMFAKVDVNGDNAIPLYNWLKSKEKGMLFDAIKWNFTKFLINRQGIPVARYAPNTNPMQFKDAIEAELKKS